MKTNHQRNFKSSLDPKHLQRKYIIGGSNNYSELADRTISAHALASTTRAVSAKKRTRKDIAGAKKFVRTRTRFHENAATRKLQNEYKVKE